MCKYIFVLSFPIFVGVAQRLRPLQEQALRFNEESNRPARDVEKLNSLARFLFGLSPTGLRTLPRSSRLASSYRPRHSFNLYAYSNPGNSRFVHRFGKAVMRAEEASDKKPRAKQTKAKRRAETQTKGQQSSTTAQSKSSIDNEAALLETTQSELSETPSGNQPVIMGPYSNAVVDDQPIVPIGKASSTRSASSPNNEPETGRPTSRSSVHYSDSVVDDRPIVPIGKATSARPESPSKEVAARDLPTSRSSVHYSDSVVDDRPLVPIPAMPGRGASVGVKPSGNGPASRSSAFYSESPSVDDQPIVPVSAASKTLENVASSLSGAVSSVGEDSQESYANTEAESYSGVQPMARSSQSDVIDDRPLVPLSKVSSSRSTGNTVSRDLPTSRSSVHYSDSVVDDRPIVPIGKATFAQPESSSDEVVSRDLPTSRSSVHYSDSDSVVDDQPIVPIGKVTSPLPEPSSNKVVSRDLPTSRSSVHYSDSVVDDRPIVPIGKVTSPVPESSSNKVVSPRDPPTSRSSVRYYDSVVDDRPIVPIGKATSKNSASQPTDEEEV